MCGVLAALLGAGLGTSAGRRLADVLGPALGEPTVGRALVVGMAFLGLAVGVALGVVVPGPEGLGDQLAAAPATAVDRAAATVGPPALLLVGGTTGVTLPLAAPVVAASPGGGAAVCALPALLAASSLAGAQLASAARLSLSGPRAIALVGAVVLLGLAAVAVAGHEAAAAIAGGSAVPAIVLGGCALVATCAGWGLVACLPRRATTRRRASRSLGTRPGSAALRAAVLLLLRRGDLRAALVGAVLVGASGIGIALVAGAPPPSGLLLGVTGAALTAAPCALAVGGRIGDGRHVWRLAPARLRVGAAWCAACLIGTAPAAAAVCLALAADGVRGEDLGVAAAIAITVCALGLGAGCVVPWRGDGIADQALPLAALGLGLGALSLAAAKLGPLAVTRGVPSALAGALIVCVVVVIGAAGIIQLLGREG
ncbi:MAG: hypothetical protein ACRC50_01420 [Gaiella sp.]